MKATVLHPVKGGLVLLALASLTSCTSPGKKTAIGAGVGAAAGAGLGAIIGHQSGNAGKGALLGAAAGGLLGGAVGNRLDKQAKELEAIAETRRTDNGIVTQLKGDILFESGQAALKPAAQENISKLGNIIKKYPEDRLVVIGHTDGTGKPEANQKLSEQRANAVMVQLLAAGVPKESVTVVGMGSSQPIAPNNTADGRSKNRRVEMQITVDESKVKQ